MPTGPRRVIRRPPAPASSYDDEPDDAPARPARERKPKGDDSGLIVSGWGGVKQMASDMPGDYAPTLQVSEDKTIIKFLEDQPVAGYRQHWAEWLPQGSRLSYVCRKVDCPLCEVGDRPSLKVCFNVLDFTDTENPRVVVFVMTRTVSSLVSSFHADRKTTPLSRPDVYYAVWKTKGKGSGRRAAGTTQTNVVDVKARDLFDDYDIEPLDEDELAAYSDKLWTPEQIIQTSTYEELDEIAAAYTQ